MKLKFTYSAFFILSVFILIVMRSNDSGRYNKTAAPGPTGSCTSGGCHATGTPGTASLDSIFLFDTATSQFVSSYFPGRRYRVGFVAKYTGTANLPKYGFVIGTTRGTFSNFSANTKDTLIGTNRFWGHTKAKDSLLKIPVVNITYYTDTAVWTAPPAGSGNVNFQGRFNAVNGNGANTGDASNNFPVNKIVTEYAASVNIARVGFGAICPGATVNFNATPTNGGATPTYQWKINSTNVGTNSPMFSTTALVNNDTVKCIMTSSIPGIPNSPDTSNFLIMTVNAPFVNTPTISADKTTVCAGDTAIYTCTPAAGSTGTQFRWYVNGTQVAGPPINASSATYTKIGGFTVNDSIRATVNVFNQCASFNPGSSNTIVMTVSPSPVLSNVVNQIVCAGQPTVATSWNSTIAGTTYTWTNSNTLIGLPASGTGQIPVFTATNNNPGIDSGTIVIQPTGSGCKGAVVRMKYFVKPLAQVRKASDLTLCQGSTATVNFTTIPVVGTTVNWTSSNSAIGLSSNGTGNINFTAGNSSSDDSAISTITTNATLNGCVGPDSAFTIKIYKSPTMTQPADVNVCTGSSVPASSFSSNIPGSTFTWNNNNTAINLGATGIGDYPSFTPAGPGSATISVSARYKTCTGPAVSYKITIGPPSTPAVSISTSTSTICAGGSVFFSSSPTNGGSSPTYQWYKNNVPIGTNADTFTAMNIGNNDSVWVVMTSSSSCVTSPTAKSNVQKINLSAKIVSTVSIFSTKDSACIGDVIQYTAITTNGGSSPIYRWYVNDVLVSSGGAGNDIFPRTISNDMDVIRCDFVSSITCVLDSVVKSKPKIARIFPVIPMNLTLLKDKTKICSDDYVRFYIDIKNGSSNPSYDWRLNGQNMNTNAPSMTIPINNEFDVVSFTYNSNYICSSPRSISSFLTVDSVIQGPTANYTINHRSLPANQERNYASFCDGDSAKIQLLNTQPDFKYLWSNGLTTDSFYSNISTSYRVTITSPNYQCPRVYGPLTTYVQPRPNKPIIVNRGGGTLEASVEDNYQWQLNQLDIVNEVKQKLIYPQPGLYRVKTTNNAGCSNFSEEIDPSKVGIQSLTNAGITIYPNPSNGIFTVNSDSKILEAVSIFDVFGKEIYRTIEKTQKLKIDISNLSKGTYLLRIESNGESFGQKIELR
jgi:hypothetical protein